MPLLQGQLQFHFIMKEVPLDIDFLVKSLKEAQKNLQAPT